VRIEDRYRAVLRTVAAGRRTTGHVTVRWNGRDGRGKLVPRGSYVVHVSATSEIGVSELRLPARIGR
jgi:hypothetical protein